MKLTNLFLLAAISSRTLGEAEYIQHTPNVYAKILQPELWAQWVREKMDLFDEGKLTVCQDFMNLAVLKCNKIIAKHRKFKGSITSIQ